MTGLASDKPAELARRRIMLAMSALILSTVVASLDSSFVPIAVADMIEDLDSSTSEVVRVAPTCDIAAPALAAVASAPAADTNAQFDQYCIGCHGPDARGVANLGVDLVASAFVAKSSQQVLLEFLKAGRLPDDPANSTGRPMPGFSWVPEGELESVAGFLKSRGGAQQAPLAPQ